MTDSLPPISLQIWDQKYRFKEFDGTPIDGSLDDTWRRVAKALAAVESDPGAWEDQFFDIMQQGYFSPAGRIISGAGTGRHVTLSNCFTMGTIPDSMDGIFTHLKEAALTMQQGGGIGYDFSTLRPKGAEVKGVAADASGPLTFMDVWDAMCRTVMSAGCLHGDTLVTTDRGFLPISEIVKERLPVKVKTHEGWKHITDYFENGVSDTVEVFLENGRSIVCTPAHRFHTIDESGELVKKPIGEMSVGDTCLFVADYFPSQEIKFTVIDTLSYVLGHYWANGYTHWRSKGEDDERLHYVAISYSQCELGEKSIEKCKAALSEAGYEFALCQGDGKCTVLKMYGDHARNFVSLCGAKPYSSEIKYPSGVSDIPFIAGYFDGDGSWKSGKKGPHFCSTSRKMLEQVQDILADRGIPAKLHSEVRPNNWKTLHRLLVSGPYWQQKFKDLFGEWLTKVAQPVHQKSHNFVYPPQIMRSVEWSHRHIHGKIAIGQNIGRQTFAEMFPESDMLKFGAMRITDIQARDACEVFDLEVEDTHSYVANGLSLSNSRRGAMMATMRCDHPDIEAFIEAKRDPLKLRMFNLSVLVTDDLMDAVKNDLPWRLHFEDKHGDTVMEKVIGARDLWNKIMRSTYEYAEPGVIFIDRVNKDHNLSYLETIATTNPCAEKPMGPYASCLLGSINLAKMIKQPFGAHARVLSDRLLRTVQLAVRMMDNVIEAGDFPLPEQRKKASDDRQLGLGVTGLADALIMCGLTYGTPEAAEWTENVMRDIAMWAYGSSVLLAKEKGAFATFDRHAFLHEDHFAARLPNVTLRNAISDFGIRNGLLLSIAPTGTISLLAGNVSSGIEPVFALSYDRKVLQPDGSRTVERVEDYAVAQYRALYPGNELPDYFVTAQTLAPEAHVRMQAAAQKWIDSSISKTVNCPEDISFEDFKAIYQSAYDLGCKGCTTYRPNDVTGSVLSVAEEPKKEPVVLTLKVDAADAIDMLDAALSSEAGAKVLNDFGDPEPAPRPDVLEGATHKIRWPGSEHAIYVTISDVVENGRRRPFEVFINSKNMEHFAWTVALTRMMSAVFRRPHDSRFVVEELKAVFDPKGGAWVDGKYIPSVLAAIGGAIEQHMKDIGYIETPKPDPLKATQEAILRIKNGLSNPVGALCGKCSSSNVKNEAGCFQCLDCGESKCG